MPPLNKFTTKSKDAIKKAHELAIERGQNHVSTLHLLAALLLQEESSRNNTFGGDISNHSISSRI